jgi:hypothetical protein
MVVVPIIAGLHLAGCHTKAAKPVKIKPAVVEKVQGSSLGRLTLTAKAAQRLDIKTGVVSEAQQRKVVPYAAVLYDANGQTWVYTSPEPLIFVRHRIAVDRIDGDQAMLSEGPPVGTQVVTVGGAELFGAEFEIGK